MRIKKPTEQEWKDWVMQDEYTTPAPDKIRLALLKLYEAYAALPRDTYLFDPEKDRIKWVRPRSPELWARLTNWAKLTKENK